MGSNPTFGTISLTTAAAQSTRATAMISGLASVNGAPVQSPNHSTAVKPASASAAAISSVRAEPERARTHEGRAVRKSMVGLERDQAVALVRDAVEDVDRFASSDLEALPRRVRVPVVPRSDQRIAALEREPPAGREVVADGAHDGADVPRLEEDLEDVPGHDREVEPILEREPARISLDPLHALTAGPPAGDLEHGGGWIEACDEVTTLGQVDREHARATAEVEDTHRRVAGETEIELDVVTRRIGRVVEGRQSRIAEDRVRQRGVVGHGARVRRDGMAARERPDPVDSVSSWW